VYLDLSSNAVGRSAGALLDPAVMPRLGECRLACNKLPRALAEKLIDCEGRSVSV
jgi:hypothetical protein